MFSRKGFGRIGLLNPPATRGGAALLQGESGLGIDFSDSSGVGSVSVIGHTTNYNNVPVDSFLTNSGTSPKLVRNAAGTYVFSAHNLGLQSSDWSNASWTKSANASATATRVTVSSAASPSQGITQDTTTVADFRYAARIKAKYVSVQWVILRLDSSGEQHCWFDILTGVKGTEGTNSSGTITGPDSDGYYTLVVTAPATGAVGTNALYLTAGDNSLGAAVGAVDLKEFQRNRGTTPTTYLATTTAAKFAVPMDYDSGWAMLVEPAATNLWLYSQDQSFVSTTIYNVLTNATIGTNLAVSPDGLTTADKLQETTANGVHQVYQDETLTAAAYTFSVYLKAAERSWAALRFDPGGGTENDVYFDLANGAVGTVDADLTGATITPVGNGWYRCTVTETCTVATWFAVICTATANGTRSYAGTTNSGIYIWNPQIELGTIATSPIPTFAASVTRAADTIYALGTAFPISATEGTVIVEAASNVINSTLLVWEMGEGTSSAERLHCTAGNSRQLYVIDGNVVQADLSPGTFVAGVFSKVASAFKANDFAASIDGSAASTDTSGTLPVMDAITLGSARRGTTGHMNGKIRSLVYLPRRMSNAELQTRTT